MRGTTAKICLFLAAASLYPSGAAAFAIHQIRTGIDLIKEDYELKAQTVSEKVDANFFPAFALGARGLWTEDLYSDLGLQIGWIRFDEAEGSGIPEQKALFLALDLEALGYRWNFFESPAWNGSLDLFGGYLFQRMDFDTDTPPLILPNNTYHIPQLGARLKLLFGGELARSNAYGRWSSDKNYRGPGSANWEFTLSFKGLPFVILSESPEESGSSTNGWGIQAGAGISYRFLNQFQAGLNYRLRYLNISPSGAANRAGVPGGESVDKITDLFHTISFTLGYAFF